MKRENVLMYCIIILLAESGVNGSTVNSCNVWPGDIGKPAFTFTYVENRPWKDLTDYSVADEHLFGKEIAQQICLIDHTYVIFTNSSDRPVIIKPIIYNSINKLRLYYKSKLKSSPALGESLIAEFSQVLTKGYVCYSEKTDLIEELLNKCKTAEAIKQVFDQIQLKG